MKETHEHTWKIIEKRTIWVDWFSCMPFVADTEIQVCACGADRISVPQYEIDRVTAEVRKENLLYKYYGVM